MGRHLPHPCAADAGARRSLQAQAHACTRANMTMSERTSFASRVLICAAARGWLSWVHAPHRHHVEQRQRAATLRRPAAKSCLCWRRHLTARVQCTCREAAHGSGKAKEGLPIPRAARLPTLHY